MKRMLGLLLALAVMVGMSVPAFAQEKAKAEAKKAGKEGEAKKSTTAAAKKDGKKAAAKGEKKAATTAEKKDAAKKDAKKAEKKAEKK